MSDTRHSLAGYQGEAALMQIEGEQLSQIVEVALRCGWEDRTIEEVIKRMLHLSILLADRCPDAFRKIFAKQEDEMDTNKNQGDK